MSRAERNYLAQELHDGIAQDLVGLGYSLDLLLSTPDTPVTTRAELRGLRFTVSDLLEKVRREIHQLHSGGGKKLSTLIEESAHELCETLIFDCDIQDVVLDPDGDLAYGIHQIARELLRNVATHSKATHVSIYLSYSEQEIFLRIADDGIGGMTDAPQRFGLVGAKSRATSLGGTLAVESKGSGTNVELRVPISRQDPS